MSFFLTTAQFEARTKTVTRRLAWWDLKPGEWVMGVKKGQGIPKGGKVEKLHAIRIKSVRPEKLSYLLHNERYAEGECIMEGFPEKTPKQFVEMFCEHNGCEPDEMVNRIEFEHL